MRHGRKRYMNVKRYPAAAAAAGVVAVMVFLVAPVGSQLTRPADDEAQTTTSTQQIAQPGEFVELATRACRLKAVYAKGAGYVETSEELEKPLPPEMKKMAFEVWVVPPLAKTAMPAPQQVRVSDGKCVYTLVRGPKATLYGRKRRITPTNFYSSIYTFPRNRRTIFHTG